MTQDTNTQGQVPEALQEFEVRKLAAIGLVHTSSGLVERRPIEYRRELEDQFVRGYRAAEKRLHALAAGQATAAPTHEQIAAYLESTGAYVTNDATREAAIAEAIDTDRAKRGQALRLLTQKEKDSLGRRAEGMDGNEWDQWVQEKFAQVNGLKVQGGSYEWDWE